MTFNENSRLDTSGVSKRGRGGVGKGAAIGGGSVVVLIIAFVISQFLGVDVTGLVDGSAGGGQVGPGEELSLEHCQTGADANQYVECRMVGAQNSLDQFWAEQAPAAGISYQTPGFVIYDGQTSSACGTASNAVGPFYCPADTSMYIDVTFFDILSEQYGSSSGALAEMYVVAHEWGHHMQYLFGILQQIDNQQTGPASDGVRLELQADCFAGAWVAGAATTRDAQGNQLLQPPTRAEIADALSAAAAVGDDHIQQTAGQQVNPESFSHGTSEQRQAWFTTGYEQGWQACDTFSIPGSSL